MNKAITKTVFVLSMVSLFNDIGTEMLYPIMPVFLKSIGFGYVLIGILEGVAETVAGLSKPYFGKMSDDRGKRLPFVQLGYLLSVIARPLMAVFIYPWWIFLARTLDKIGKGVRTGARDAMLSDEATPATKARVFGFHRSFDTLGAVIGPIVALIFLYFYPGSYKTLFIVAFIPGLLVLLTTFFVKEKRSTVPVEKTIASRNIFGFLQYWKKSPKQYKQLMTGLLLFALFNSSDAFLLLKMKESGMTDVTLVGIYVFYNLVYAALSYPLGILADRIGMKKILLSGLAVFAIVYTGFAFTSNAVIYLLLFSFYGCYAAATDGVSKAWVSNMVPRSETATAIGTFSGLQSIALLVASSLTGFVWYRFGSTTGFLMTAAVTIIAIVYLSRIKFIPSGDR